MMGLMGKKEGWNVCKKNVQRKMKTNREFNKSVKEKINKSMIKEMR